MGFVNVGKLLIEVVWLVLNLYVGWLWLCLIDVDCEVYEVCGCYVVWQCCWVVYKVDYDGWVVSLSDCGDDWCVCFMISGQCYFVCDIVVMFDIDIFEGMVCGVVYDWLMCNGGNVFYCREV